MGEVIYNGQSSKDFGLEVETFPAYESPKRSYEKVHIPGRNGDLIIDSGCWENATRTYEVSVGSLERDYYRMMNDVSEWLRSTYTYARLEDSYEPEYYRLAVFLEEFSMSNLFNQGGKGSIVFDCKPQRFLKNGDEILQIKNGAKIQNPTTFSSLPIIRIYGSGSGSLTVGQYHVTISEIGTQIVLDSEIQDAYYGTTNKNQQITIPDGFPVLDPGSTTIGFSGGITKVEVIPKWFTL